MKQWIAGLLLCVSVTAGAVDAAKLLTPSPVGVILALKTYFRDHNKVYYIRVEATSSDFEKAKQQAFRLASEQVAGTVVLSEGELRNSNLDRNEIITYSSGLIDEYRMVSRTDAPGAVRVVVDVWITESVMAQRLLARSATEKGIDGPGLAVRSGSILEERQRGDAIFQAILRDFPRRAFDVKMSKHSIVMDPSRNLVLYADVEINWDRRYIAAFYDAAQKTGRKPCAWRCPPGARFYIQGWEFDDIQRLLLIDQIVGKSNMHIQMDIVGVRGNTLKQQCFEIGSLSSVSMYGFGGNQLSLWEKPYRARVHALLDSNPALLNQISNVRVEVVNSSQCR